MNDGNEVEKRLMEIVTVELKDHERRIADTAAKIATLETRATVIETDVKYVKDDIKTIRDNTTWLLRIVIGAIVVALLGVIFVKSPSAKPTSYTEVSAWTA